MSNKNYVKKVEERMKNQFPMSSRLDEYLEKVGAVKSKPKSNLGLKLAIPLVGVLTCCVGVLTTYEIMKGKISNKFGSDDSEYLNLVVKYFTSNGFDKFSSNPSSSYTLSPNSNLYIYAAEKNEEIFYISQIFTSKKTKESVKLSIKNDSDSMKELNKLADESSYIEVINDDEFFLDNTVVYADVYLNDEYSSSLTVNLINNL